MEPARSNWLQIHTFSMPATNGEKRHDEGAAVGSEQDAALIEKKKASTIPAAINETYNQQTEL